MDEQIKALRQELEAARRKLSGTPEPDKRERLIGYISGLQVSMNLLKRANQKAMASLPY